MYDYKTIVITDARWFLCSECVSNNGGTYKQYSAATVCGRAPRRVSTAVVRPTTVAAPAAIARPCRHRRRRRRRSR